MQEILSAGIELIVWLQSFDTPALDRFFAIYTKFGGSYYLYLFPLIVWCVDYRTGLVLLPLFAITLFVNTTLKEWLAQPRPFQMDSRVVSDGEQGYGLPSGHAQLAVVFWGVIARQVALPGFWALAVLVMFLMGVSRVWLGVHFPSDVVAGWILGALLLWAALHYWRPGEDWLGGRALAPLLSAACGAAAFVFAVDAWFVHDHDRINVGAAGVLLGAGVGAVLGLRRLHFDGRGPGWQRVLRFALGMPLTLLLIGVFQSWGVPEGAAAANGVIALDLAILGLWVTLVAPWLFQRIRLAPAPAD